LHFWFGVGGAFGGDRLFGRLAGSGLFFGSGRHGVVWGWWISILWYSSINLNLVSLQLDIHNTQDRDDRLLLFDPISWNPVLHCHCGTGAERGIIGVPCGC